MQNQVNKEKIYEFLKEKSLSKTAFCKLCKISPQTYNKIMSGSTKFRLTALIKIAREMKIHLFELF